MPCEIFCSKHFINKILSSLASSLSINAIYSNSSLKLFCKERDKVKLIALFNLDSSTMILSGKESDQAWCHWLRPLGTTLMYYSQK